MDYRAHLTKLLRPLGVYDLSEQSLSGCELSTLGQALDTLNDTITANLCSAIPETAEASALEGYFSILCLPDTADTERSRAALRWLLRARGREIQCSELSELLQAYCPKLTLEETGVNRVRVTLPETTDAGLLRRWKTVIEQIMPSQILISYQ